MIAPLLVLMWSALPQETAATDRVPVDASGCPGLDAQQLQRIVDVELAARVAREGTRDLRARLHCEGAQVHMELTSPSRLRRARVLDLSVVKDDATAVRLVALAVAEGVAWSGSQADESRREPAAQPALSAVAPPHAPGAWEITVAGRWRSPGAGRPSLWGAAFSLEGWAERWGVGAAVGLETAQTALAAVSVRAWATTLQLQVARRFRMTAVDVRVGAGIETGWALLQPARVAEGVDPNTVSAPLLAPMFTLALTKPIGSLWQLRLRTAAGWTMVGVKGTDPERGAFAVTGPWCLVDVGVGVRP